MDHKKTQPGQKFQFSASLYNDLIDTVKWAKSQRKLGGSGQNGGESSPNVLMIQNKSGSTIPRFGVLEISGKIGNTQDFENLKAIKGVKPTSALKPVVVLQAAAKADEIAEAIVGGTTMAAVTVSATTDTHAEPVASQWRMKTGTTGRFRIIQPLTSTGEQNVLVRFESSPPAKGLPKVQNRSGVTVPPWGFLVVDGATPLPSSDLTGFQSSPVFQGFAPSGDFNSTHKRLVSVPGGAAANEIVDCILDGYVPAIVSSAFLSDPKMAHAFAGSVSKLEARFNQSHFGLPIVWRETGTGDKWGIVDLTPQNQLAVVVGSGSKAPSAWTMSSGGGFAWSGNPWAQADLFNNGTVEVQAAGSSLRFPKNTSWMGEVVVPFRLTYSGLVNVSGSTSLIRVPGFTASFGIGFSSGTNYVTTPAKVGELPSILSFLDSSALYQIDYSLSIPLTFQTWGGADYSDLTFILDAKFLGGAGQISFQLQSPILRLHEIDPLMLKGSSPTSGSSSGGGFVSSGSVSDPFTQYSGGVNSATGLLTSGGLSTSSNTSTGFE